MIGGSCRGHGAAPDARAANDGHGGSGSGIRHKDLVACCLWQNRKVIQPHVNKQLTWHVSGPGGQLTGIVQASGGQTVVRPMFRGRPDLDSTVTDVEPLAGLQAATSLKHAARRLALEYVRQAREANDSWHEVGAALGFGQLAESGSSVAGAAYDYASAGPDAWSRSFLWACPACQERSSISGRRLGTRKTRSTGTPADCPRLAAAVTAWNASGTRRTGSDSQHQKVPRLKTRPPEELAQATGSDCPPPQ